jgi:hypothetical protein
MYSKREGKDKIIREKEEEWRKQKDEGVKKLRS